MVKLLLLLLSAGKLVLSDRAHPRDEAEYEGIVRFAVHSQLEGLYRHASTHAAGLVIADRYLPKLVPVYRDPRSDMPVTQFNMKAVEKVGLVKFDFLGLKTLTVINKAVSLLKMRGIDVDIDNIVNVFPAFTPS